MNPCPSTYPAAIEAWWVQRALRHFRLRDEKTAMERLVPAVQQLSDLFTKERSLDFGDYANSRELLLAYGLYAFPQTFHRNALVRDELARLGVVVGSATPPDQPVRMLDLGCGAGAGGAAWLKGLTKRRCELRGIDASEEQVRLYEYLLKDNPQEWSELRWRLTVGDLREPLSREEGRFDLILASFSLNEAFYDRTAEQLHDWVDSLRDQLRPSGLLVLVEPALKETTLRLMRLRDALAGQPKAWELLAPCPHALACPMLQEGRYWCHEVHRWQPPPSLQRLNNHLERPLHELKFSFLALRNGGGGTTPPLPPAHARLVAPVSKVKGRYLTRVCDHSGELLELDLMTRHLSVQDKRELDDFQRGDRVVLGEKTPLGGERSYRLASRASLQPLPSLAGEAVDGNVPV